MKSFEMLHCKLPLALVLKTVSVFSLSPDGSLLVHWCILKCMTDGVSELFLSIWKEVTYIDSLFK